MAEILLVEDNPHIMNINTRVLEMRGYLVHRAENLRECREQLEAHEINLIVLDIMLPDGDGISFCKELKQKRNIPVLFLSALSENEDVVAGLRAGGDDYLAKPYDLEVFLARVEARLRSVEGHKRFWEYGKLRLDTVSLGGWLGEEDLKLSQKEYAILFLLIQHPEECVDGTVLCQTVWGTDLADGSQMMYTTISRLKKKLNREVSDVTVTARRKEGYALEKL
jgi:DNA-binding response OmpR family regulator